MSEAVLDSGARSSGEARSCRRLVSRQAGFWRALGQGHDVDFPAFGYLHL